MLAAIVAHAECGTTYDLFVNYKNQQQIDWTETHCGGTRYGNYFRVKRRNGDMGLFKCLQKERFEDLAKLMITAGANVQLGKNLIGGKFDEDTRKVFDTSLREMEYAYVCKKMLEEGTTI